MKKVILAAAVAIALAATSANAGPIVIRSTGSSPAETNTGVNGAVSGGQQTVALSPAHGSWYSPAGRTWVSFVNNYSPTPGGQSACGGSLICNDDWVDFFHTFELPVGVFTGYLSVLADDTADVYVNGTKVYSRAPEYPVDPYATCAGSPIGCLSATQAVINIAGYLKTDGSENLLRFTVFQENGTGFGLNYEAQLNAASVPEPGASFVLLGTGLAGLAGAARRWRRRS